MRCEVKVWGWGWGSVREVEVCRVVRRSAMRTVRRTVRTSVRSMRIGGSRASDILQVVLGLGVDGDC